MVKKHYGVKYGVCEPKETHHVGSGNEGGEPAPKSSDSEHVAGLAGLHDRTGRWMGGWMGEWVNLRH